MNTQDQTIEEEQLIVRDLTGDLADSARRHLAYLALAEKIATSENALQQLLDVIERRRATARRGGPEGETYGNDDRD